MAVVRCPIHDIPYNDSNPRGCPACAHERKGSDPTAEAIRELARASSTVKRPEGDPLVQASAGRPSRASVAAPITPPPRAPTVEETRLRRALRWADRQRVLTAGSVVILVSLTYLALTAGPDFVPGADPPHHVGDVHALPVEPGQPVDLVFTVLGPRAPQEHPEHPSLARYAYGSRLMVDGLNGNIYQITIGIPNWTWRGLTVGLSPRHLEGMLALLGQAQTIEEPEAITPRRLGRWAVYPSLEARPRRVLLVEVRPPNGCFDVFVELRPRAVGIVESRERRFAAVGEAEASLEWVSTEVRVVNRMPSGPAGPSVCPTP